MTGGSERESLDVAALRKLLSKHFSRPRQPCPHCGRRFAKDDSHFFLGESVPVDESYDLSVDLGEATDQGTHMLSESKIFLARGLLGELIASECRPQPVAQRGPADLSPAIA